MYFLMTVDVESFSIPLNRCDYETGKRVYEQGLPSLLDLFAKHDCECTFYFTGEMAEMFPEAVEIVRDAGHEIGCHGYDHSPQRAFDSLRYEEQVEELKRAKKVIEDVAGRTESFRAPMLRINEDTVRALEETGFKTDSSVASQRFDGPFTFGSRRKLKWLIAPRKPYYLSYESTVRRGKSSILEIPISAFLISYSGTVMRRSPFLTKILQKYLFFEAKITNKPVVFLIHPNECLEVRGEIVPTRRSENFFEYIFADVIRQKLKLKNLGRVALRLLDELLESVKKNEPRFISVRKYKKIYDMTKENEH